MQRSAAHMQVKVKIKLTQWTDGYINGQLGEWMYGQTYESRDGRRYKQVIDEYENSPSANGGPRSRVRACGTLCSAPHQH